MDMNDLHKRLLRAQQHFNGCLQICSTAFAQSIGDQRHSHKDQLRTSAGHTLSDSRQYEQMRIRLLAGGHSFAARSSARRVGDLHGDLHGVMLFGSTPILSKAVPGT